MHSPISNSYNFPHERCTIPVMLQDAGFACCSQQHVRCTVSRALILWRQLVFLPL